MMKKMVLSVLAWCLLAISVALPPVNGAELGERVLKAGMSGEDVQQLQLQLTQQGYAPGAADGIYGKNTEAAVIAFQQVKKLNTDGIVGQDTLKALRGESTVEASRGQSPERYKKAYDMVATAYAPGPADNGRWGNLTHMGTTVRPGIIAVDPKVIPLGSRVYIKFADGTGRHAVAEDTGGAIKGNRIDIAFQTRDEAKKFGIQNIKLFLLE